MFLAFRICARPIFSEKGKDIFLFGVLPSKYSGSVAGLQFGLGFAKTIFWGKGFGKTSTEFSRPQKGVWGMNAGGVLAGLVINKISLNHQNYAIILTARNKVNETNL